MVTLKEMADHVSLLHKQRIEKAENILKKLVNILIEKYSVHKIVLLGSLLDKKRFGFHSDIDLGVEGLKDELYFLAVGDLLTEAEEFNVDLIPLEDITMENKKRIKAGKIIYEKKCNFPQTHQR